MTVLINQRVNNILDLAEKFTVFDVTHITRLFYSGNKYAAMNAQHKLTAMVNDSLLKRKRNNFNMKYYYYLDKEPCQVNHKLHLIEFYVRLAQKFGINNIEIEVEYTKLLGVRPDAFIKLRYNNRLYLYFVEVHISNNPLNIEKYEPVARTNPFGDNVFPNIIVISDKKLKISHKTFNIYTFDESFSNLNQITGG